MEIGRVSARKRKKINKAKNNANSTSGNYKKRQKKRPRKKLRKLPILILLVFAFFIYSIFSIGNKISQNKIEEQSLYKEEFISKIEKKAEEEYTKNGVLPSITMGQAILESNWGKSRLALEGNNLFGIKADKNWKGERINFTTKENYKDYIKADFRKYSSWDESISDYASFLRNNKRYEKHGMFDSKDYVKQAQALEDAGYATAINEKGEKIYADRLIAVIEKYNLRKYDIEAINKGY